MYYARRPPRAFPVRPLPSSPRGPPDRCGGALVAASMQQRRGPRVRGGRFRDIAWSPAPVDSVGHPGSGRPRIPSSGGGPLPTSLWRSAPVSFSDISPEYRPAGSELPCAVADPDGDSFARSGCTAGSVTTPWNRLLDLRRGIPARRRDRGGSALPSVGCLCPLAGVVDPLRRGPNTASAGVPRNWLPASTGGESTNIKAPWGVAAGCLVWESGRGPPGGRPLSGGRRAGDAR